MKLLFLKLEMDEYPPKVFIILLDPMIKLFDMPLIQKAQHLFLELPTPFARNDLNQFYFSVNGFFHNAIKLRIDLVAAVVNVMQVKLKFCHYFLFSCAVLKSQKADVDSA